MDYSVVAGSLVTLSLVLLFIETLVRKLEGSLGVLSIGLYLCGVVVWTFLGVLMDQAALVLISSLQVLFLVLYLSVKNNGNPS